MPSSLVRVALVFAVAMLSLTACAAASPPPREGAEPASTATTPPSAATDVGSPSTTASPASAPSAKVLTVAGKPANAVTAEELKAAVEAAGFTAGGYLFGGHLGQLEQFGVEAAKGDKRLRIGLTRKVDTVKEQPDYTKKYDVKTLYELAASKGKPVLASVFDEEKQIHLWIVDETNGDAALAKTLLTAITTPR
jgi:hypothetical protein